MQYLTQEQIRFFDTFGYLLFPGLMSNHVADISNAFEEVWKARGGGHGGRKHDGLARSCIAPFIDQSAKLCALLDDNRIISIGASLLGENFNYVGSDGNYYVGDSGWHSDGNHVGIRHLKIAFYLDPLTAMSGCLRVIPGSHNVNDAFSHSLQKSAWESRTNWGIRGDQVPSVILETKPGDVICFNHNLMHASFHGSASRRMFTINLCQRYPNERLQELKDYIAAHARFWIDRNYGPEMIRTASPDRQKHLEQIMQNDGHLAELAILKRQTMSEPARG